MPEERLDELARYQYEHDVAYRMQKQNNAKDLKALFSPDLMGASLQAHGFNSGTAADILLGIAGNDAAKDSDRIRAVESIMKLGRSLAELNGMVQEISVTGTDDEGREGRVKGKRFTSLWTEQDVMTQEDHDAAQRLAGDAGIGGRPALSNDRKSRGEDAVDAQVRVGYDRPVADEGAGGSGGGKSDAGSLG